MDLRDYRAGLEESIAREQSALVLIGRIERFLSALEDQGFGVTPALEVFGGGNLSVKLDVQCPAGLIGAPVAVEVVEAGRRPLPSFSRPDAHSEPLPPLRVEGVVSRELAQASAAVTVECLGSGGGFRGGAGSGRAPASVPPAPARRKGEPWSADEDAQLIDMIVRGVSVKEAARRLGRPEAGTGYRVCRPLRSLISAAKADLAQGRKAQARAVATPVAAKLAPVPEPTPAPVAPEPQPEPAPVKSPAPAPAPAPAPVATVRSVVSPLSGVASEHVTLALMRAHLDWLYGARPEADVVASDLELIEMLVRGDGAAGVASAFDWPKAQVLDRWHQLRGGVNVSLNLQEKLLAALRDLAQGGDA